MRIALLGDFDTFACRGLERPAASPSYHLSPGLNLLQGVQGIGRPRRFDILVCTPEVRQPTMDEGPFDRLHRLPSPRFSGSTSFFFWRRHLLLKELATIKPDIVHGQGTEGEYALTAVTSPYPDVITFHGIMERVHEVSPPPFFSLSHVPRWSEKIVAGKARHVISISSEVENFLAKHHSQAKTYRIANAMAPCFFRVQPKPADATYTLLYVGNHSAAQGAARSRGSRWRLSSRNWIVRCGCWWPVPLNKGAECRLPKMLSANACRNWESLIASNGSACSANATLAATLATKAMRWFCHPFWENMPMCIGEAMAAGVPVISTNVTGTPDWVENGRTWPAGPPGRAHRRSHRRSGLCYPTPTCAKNYPPPRASRRC